MAHVAAANGEHGEYGLKIIINCAKAFACALACSCMIPVLTQANDGANPSPRIIVDRDGTVHIPAYAVPLSLYMSDGAKRAYIDQSLHTPVPKKGSEEEQRVGTDIVTVREFVDRAIFTPQLLRARAVYAASVEERTMAGVPTEVVRPKEGVLARNRHRVLINLHAGGFELGAGTLQLIESIPIAATAKIEVVSVNYRLAPEHKLADAIDDVAAVYKELLKQYKANDIGIYGASAGGALAMMSIPWFRKKHLPRPGAIALLSPATAIAAGDSRYTIAPLNPLTGGNAAPPPAELNPPPTLWPPEYLDGAVSDSPLVSPTFHPEELAQFPPTLLLTGTRDFLESLTVHTHSELVRTGIDAQLHVWEGMWHCFSQDVDIPESKELYEVIATFFEAHLGKAARGSRR